MVEKDYYGNRGDGQGGCCCSEMGRPGGAEGNSAWRSDRLHVLVTHGMLGRALRGLVLESIQEML